MPAAKRLRELIAINRAILSSLDYNEVLHRVVERTAEFTRADACVLLLAEGEQNARVVASVNVDPEAARRFSSPLNERINKAIREMLDFHPEDTFLGAPIEQQGQIRGILAIYRRGPEPPHPEEEELLSALADQAALALEHARVVRELRDANHRKDEFLAMLAHELRNPLAPIVTAVELLQHCGGDSPSVDRQREVIQRQTRHMVRLVDDLLDVARLTQGKIELQQVPVELSVVVDHALEISRPLLIQRRHRLTVSLPSEPIYLHGDCDRLAQVLTNLLVNAAKYTDSGGHVRLTARLEEETANGEPDETANSASQIRISVRDDGRGIARALLPRVWEPFVQEDRALDRSSGGIGLGLTLVKRLVEVHGGSVEAHSDGPGTGSEFLVRLPVLRSYTAAHAQPPSPTPRPETESRRVLVVDDSRDAAESLAELLRHWGYVADIAFDGSSALRVALNFQPEILLLDIGLPGLDGYEVARRARQEPALQGVFLVAVSGYGQDGDRQKSREAGFDYHLTKPVEPEALRSLLAAEL